MLKILFNRESVVVRILEAVWIFNALLFFRNGGESRLVVIFYLFLIPCYLMIRVCDLIRWYPPSETPPGYKPRQVGIRVHFRKALVPTSFILATTSSVFLIGISWLSGVVGVIAVLCMAIITPVNGILIWFHCHDREKMPVNYFSLHKEVQLPTS